MKHPKHWINHSKNTLSTTNLYHHIHTMKIKQNVWFRYSRTISRLDFLRYTQTSYCTMESIAYTSSHEFEYIMCFIIEYKNIIIYLHFWQQQLQHHYHRTSRYKISGPFQTRPRFNLGFEWRIRLVCCTINE